MVAAGPLLGLYLAAENPVAPTTYAEAKVICSNGYYPRFFHEMLQRGINLAPGAYEVLFPSLAHSDDDFAATVAAAAAASRAVSGS